jgi:hypothetical protein
VAAVPFGKGTVALVVVTNGSEAMLIFRFTQCSQASSAGRMTRFNTLFGSAAFPFMFGKMGPLIGFP